MCLLCCTYTYILCCEKGEEDADLDSYEDISSSCWCSCCCGSKQSRANTQFGDDKCRLFLEQVKAKGVITYERFAYNGKSSPNLPLLHESHTTKYLSVARPSMALSDVTERTEDSLSISLGCSYDMNNYNSNTNDHYDYDYNNSNSNPGSTYNDPNSEFSHNSYDRNQILYPQREGESDTLPESVIEDQGESCSSSQSNCKLDNSNNSLMHKV